MRVLAVETSCDDTGVAILEYDKISQPKLLADLVSSQVKIHAPWGGIVPMLAKREHQRNLLPLLKQSLRISKLLKISNFQFRLLRRSSRFGCEGRAISNKILNSQFSILNSILEREPELLKKLKPFLKKYQKPAIDAIAVTVGPGLEPALWVGVNFARALGYFWNLPIMPINHIEAHICANWLSPIGASSNVKAQMSKLIFPAICLVVSGGHTQLILIKKSGRYEILGETRDDAAGEAFDKLAKMLELGYPGGPIISRLAQSVDVRHQDNFRDVGHHEIKIFLPRPMLNSGDFDFSFSGLKTAAFYLIKKLTPAQIKNLTPAICAEFQQAVVDVLTAKTIAATKKYQAKTVMVSGGVAANDLLRDRLSLGTKHLSLNFLVPPKNFCTDNAAMIAFAAYQKNKKRVGWQNLKADANLRI